MVTIRKKPLDPCKHCGKVLNRHSAKDSRCPAGTRTRIGYIVFGPARYEPKFVTGDRLRRGTTECPKCGLQLMYEQIQGMALKHQDEDSKRRYYYNALCQKCGKFTVGA